MRGLAISHNTLTIVFFLRQYNSFAINTNSKKPSHMSNKTPIKMHLIIYKKKYNMINYNTLN